MLNTFRVAGDNRCNSIDSGLWVFYVEDVGGGSPLNYNITVEMEEAVVETDLSKEYLFLDGEAVNVKFSLTEAQAARPWSVTAQSGVKGQPI